MDHPKRHTCPECEKTYACCREMPGAFFPCHWEDDKTKCYKCKEDTP